MVTSVSGVVGTQLGLHELERFLEQRQGQVQLSGSLVAHARLFMLVSVSGWSGPSLAFLTLQGFLAKAAGPGPASRLDR